MSEPELNDAQDPTLKEIPDDEPLLVVDMFDRVLERSTKPEVHRQRKWHRQVYILAINSREEVLLQRRSARREFDPDRWTASVSGHVTDDDSYLEAAQRESREEIGLEQCNLIFIGKVLAYSNANGKLCGGPSAVFATKFDGDVNSIRLQQSEVADVAWFPLDSVAAATNGRTTLLRHGVAVLLAEDFLPVFELFWSCYRGG